MEHATSICSHSGLASPSDIWPRCSGSSSIPGRRCGVSNLVHVRPTSWFWQERVLSVVLLLAFVASPTPVSAAPLTLRSDVTKNAVRMLPRGQNSSNSSNTQNGSINMNVWLPILLITIVFVIFSFIACLRRCTGTNSSTGSAAANQATSTPAAGNTIRPHRRPRRTPSQISTKSLPPYMKEPGDQELVLFRGPLEAEDDRAPPHAISVLTEEDEEHPEMRNTAFDIALDRIESVDTMADSSTNLIRKVSESVTRPPELHHATMPHDHRRGADALSLGSAGSEAELLPAHQRMISVDSHAGLRGEAPSYTEAVSAMTTISLNDPEPHNVSPDAIIPPLSAAVGERSRFNFLRHNPFGSHNASRLPPSTRPETPASHVQNGSVLSRFSSRESHESHHSRAPSRTNIYNLSSSHSRSSLNLLRAFHPNSHAGSSTISLDSISAPLTHTLTRAEFHAPKGGLLTPEQIKLITSREALEKFGVPYGPDAVAAFSLSRERLAGMGPPPDFDSVTGEQQVSGGSGGATGEAAQRPNMPVQGVVLPRSTSRSPTSSHSPDVRADSRASSDVSYATTPESDVEGSDSHGQAVHGDDEAGLDEADDPCTACPATPRTARPLVLGSAARYH